MTFGSLSSRGKRKESAVRQVAVGFNVLILPIAVFFALNFVLDSMSWPKAARYACGLFGAVACFLIEAVLFIIRATRAESMQAQADARAPAEVFSKGRKVVSKAKVE